MPGQGLALRPSSGRTAPWGQENVVEKQQPTAREADGTEAIASHPKRVAVLLVCEECRQFGLVEDRETGTLTALMCELTAEAVESGEAGFNAASRMLASYGATRVWPEHVASSLRI